MIASQEYDCVRAEQSHTHLLQAIDIQSSKISLK